MNELFLNLSDHKVHRYMFSKKDYFEDFIEGLFGIIGESLPIDNMDEHGVEKYIEGLSFGVKESYADVMAVINNKYVVIIELYNTYKKAQHEKSNFYINKYITKMLKPGDKFGNKKDIYLFNLIRNSDFCEPEVVNEYREMHNNGKVSYQQVFGDFNVKKVHILLDRVSEMKYTNSKSRNKGIDWLKLYTAKSFEEMLKLARGRKIMSEAIMELRDFLNDPDIKNYKTNEQMEREQELEDTRELSLKQGIEQGIERGKTEGLKEGKKISLIQTAKNMIKLGETDEKISLYTTLPVTAIKKLRNG